MLVSLADVIEAHLDTFFRKGLKMSKGKNDD
jgi:hypothetical protein